eukprot:m.295989 g.295989  ORF g.295989 m.295989 type:complete len:212 (+) comp15855_c0_seq37:2175-2810(+)
MRMLPELTARLSRNSFDRWMTTISQHCQYVVNKHGEERRQAPDTKEVPLPIQKPDSLFTTSQPSQLQQHQHGEMQPSEPQPPPYLQAPPADLQHFRPRELGHVESQISSAPHTPTAELNGAFSHLAASLGHSPSRSSSPSIVREEPDPPTPLCFNTASFTLLPPPTPFRIEACSPSPSPWQLPLPSQGDYRDICPPKRSKLLSMRPFSRME